jgi:hypothetical protein
MPPPTQPAPYTKPRVLIGEGRDEVAFFEAFLTHLGVQDVQVEEFGGKPNLSRYLREFGLRPGHENVVALGITRDSDGPVASAFQSIGGFLTNCSLPVPVGPGKVQAGTPRVGVFILPDNQREGMLEDLCMDAVQADGAVPCVADFFQCVARQTQPQRQPSPMAKARVHAWLASQLVPDLRLGEAAKKGYWPWSSTAFDALRQFLRNF